MSQASGDDFLIDLFREEVRTNCQILADGLVSLEQGGVGPERLEAMMRAAHSIKGAARVVNVQPGVDVVHAMEDCFVQAQKAELTLTSNIVDVLLAGVDMLQGIAAAAGVGFTAWLENSQPEVAQLLQRLDHVVRESKLPVSPGPAFADNQTTATDAAQTSALKESVAPPAPPIPAIESSPQPAPPIVGAKSAETPTEEGVVRVTARSLTRLMGLAGESLVESRWLQPFSKSLLQLKHLQTQLADTLESFATADPSEISEERFAALRNDAREQLAACRELLADRMSEFDRRIRNTDDLSSRLYHEVISSRMRPFRDGVQGLPRLVRDLARQMGKKVQLEIQGETTEVDRDILERLDAPLNHLVRNALDHGLETPEERQALGKPEIGRLHIEAAHRAGLLSITVSDDGRGIDMRTASRSRSSNGDLPAPTWPRKLSDSRTPGFPLPPRILHRLPGDRDFRPRRRTRRRSHDGPIGRRPRPRSL